MDQFQLINIKLHRTFYMKSEPRFTVSRCIKHKPGVKLLQVTHTSL